MPQISNWLIYRSDGQYVGQAKAFAATVAFCQYMVLLGDEIREDEVVVKTIDSNTREIRYDSESFVLMAQE
jgi:hypothetical protein